MDILALSNDIITWLARHAQIIAPALALLFATLGILSALEAIMKTRTAQGAVAWAIVLITVPPLFVPLYWIFGRRKFRGYAIAKGGSTREIDQLITSFENNYRAHQLSAQSNEKLLNSLNSLCTLPFSRGNQARLLIDGDAAFSDIFDHIRRARHYVLLEFYIVRDDEIGRTLAQLLIEKCRQGVAVHFLYDEIGSLKLSRAYIQNLRQAGVEIHPFNSTKGLGNRLQLNFRNHRKIVVCDGHYCVIGGMNIGDEYRHRHHRLSPWRDTGLAINGPAVQAVQLAFAEDWYWAREQVLTLNWNAVAAAENTQDIAIMSSGPADSVETCALYFQTLIHQARHRLWIVSPYFVPDPPIVQALQLAALRGVDVRIMLPELVDKQIIKLSSYTAIKESLPHGVQFYYYQRGFLHQKVLLVDDDISAVGTANLDNRSLRLNFEICAVIHGQQCNQEIARMLEGDFAHCRQLLPVDVAKWGLGRRLLSRCAYLFAPLQ